MMKQIGTRRDFLNVAAAAAGALVAPSLVAAAPL
jgi:hypothetical protein